MSDRASTGPRVGLVLGSGGLAGTAFHAGVVTALWRELGWDARRAAVIVGTSAGSTSAALVRAGLPPEDFAARMTRQPMSPEGERLLGGMPAVLAPADEGAAPWTLRRVRPAAPAMLTRSIRRPWSVRPGAWFAAAVPEGRVSNDDLRRSFAGVLASWPAEPLWICAMRLSDGSRVVFGRDDSTHPSPSIAEAVAASCAIPGYFAPVRVGEDRYVDGGAFSLCNVDLTAGLGLDGIVVSAPMSTGDRLHTGRDHVWRRVARRQLAGEVRAVASSGTPVLVLHPTRADREAMRGGSLDPNRRPAVARQALASVTDALRDAEHPVLDLLRDERR